jgi:hypothetical protein
MARPATAADHARRHLRALSEQDTLFEEWLIAARVETMECRVAARHRLPMISDEGKTTVRRKRGITLVSQDCEWCGCTVIYRTDAQGYVSGRRSGYADYAEDYLMPPGAGRFTSERRAIVRKVLEAINQDKARAARLAAKRAPAIKAARGKAGRSAS